MGKELDFNNKIYYQYTTLRNAFGGGRKQGVAGNRVFDLFYLDYGLPFMCVHSVLLSLTQHNSKYVVLAGGLRKTVIVIATKAPRAYSFVLL
jgi:hypothetical protein